MLRKKLIEKTTTLVTTCTDITMCDTSYVKWGIQTYTDREALDQCAHACMRSELRTKLNVSFYVK